MALTKYFGTDGIRGSYGNHPIVGKFFTDLADSVERYFRQRGHIGGMRVCIGMDTRESSATLVKALAMGFSADVEVLHCGILPTPAIAEVTVATRSSFGMVVTASHNQYADNGVKIFNGMGEKLTVSDELAIEDLLEQSAGLGNPSAVASGGSGATIVDFHGRAKQFYVDKYVKLFPKRFLSGLRIALDSANGSTYEVAREIFENFGASIIHIGNEPNGTNINSNCGSEHHGSIIAAMKSSGALLGIANDGDGDRVVIFDETGEAVDGDVIIGLLARNLLSNDEKKRRAIAVTVQSNAGLDIYLKQFNIDVIRCDVGDRNVYQAMVKHGCMFGGENSGHLIFRQFSPIGDGITAALQILSFVIGENAKLSKLKTKIALLPKKSFNISVDRKVPIEKIPNLSEDLEIVKSKLPLPHSVVMRYSGTESKLRVSIEASDESSVNDAWSSLKESIVDRMAESDISAWIS